VQNFLFVSLVVTLLAKPSQPDLFTTLEGWGYGMTKQGTTFNYMCFIVAVIILYGFVCSNRSFLAVWISPGTTKFHA
jgi:hypothetical protein